MHVHVYMYVCVCLYAWKLHGNLSANAKKSLIETLTKILTGAHLESIKPRISKMINSNIVQLRAKVIEKRSWTSIFCTYRVMEKSPPQTEQVQSWLVKSKQNPLLTLA